MIEIQAPNAYQHLDAITVFLGGSIEMNSAEEWQKHIIRECADTDITFLNPRRDNWNNSVPQVADNPEFAEQVNWELDALNYADLVVFYFDPNTKSPITLMELGLMAKTAQKLVIVCCPDGYWRKGNVEIVCKRHWIPVVDTLEEVIVKIRNLK